MVVTSPARNSIDGQQHNINTLPKSILRHTLVLPCFLRAAEEGRKDSDPELPHIGNY
jgi:hypothetical protein